MRTVTALMMTRLMQHLTTRMTRTGSPWSGRRRILKMPSRTSLTNITRTTQRSWTVDSGYMFLNIAFTLSSHRIDDFLLIILSFLYADIYLISSARNKYIILSNILLFPPLCWHPPKQGRGWLYSSREHNRYSYISIFMPKGSFQHQHEHETCIRFNLDILEERKYLWSQTLCQCLVRSVTTVSSLMIGPSVKFQTVIGCFWVALQIWSYPHIASHGIRIWWTCSVCSAYSKSRD